MFVIFRITYIFRRKGVVREWFGNGRDTSVSGKVEFLQQTEYDTTDLEFSLNGIHDAGVYHIHYVSILYIMIKGSVYILSSFFV